MSVRQRRCLPWLGLAALGLATLASTLILGAASGATCGRSWMDVDYVGDGKVSHRLDILLPAKGSGPFAVVIGISGSAWTRDDTKATFSKILSGPLCDAGLATVAINHRGTVESGDTYPAQIHDVKAAVRFIRANAAKYNLDPERIAVWGGSSGGHLAALLGTSGGVNAYTVGKVTMSIEGTLGQYLTTSSRVQAVVDFCGPTNFLTANGCYFTKDHNAPGSPESVLIGGPIQEHPDECALANPMTYIDAGDSPFFIAHGSKDPQVAWCQSQELHDALVAAGVPSTFKLVTGAGHTDVATPEIIAAAISFLKQMPRARD